jgi:hypothetical protein
VVSVLEKGRKNQRKAPWRPPGDQRRGRTQPWGVGRPQRPRKEGRKDKIKRRTLGGLGRDRTRTPGELAMGPMGAAMPKGAQGKRKKAKEVTGKKKERKQDRNK